MLFLFPMYMCIEWAIPMKNIPVAFQHFVKLRWHWCMILWVHLSSLNFILICLVFSLVLLQAVQAMVQQAMQYIDQTPDIDTKIELIKTLNSVSAGKVSTFSFWWKDITAIWFSSLLNNYDLECRYTLRLRELAWLRSSQRLKKNNNS